MATLGLKEMTQSIEDETKAREISFHERLAASERKCNSPRNGLAGVVKNKFLPREAEPRVVGILFFTTTAKPRLGELKLP